MRTLLYIGILSLAFSCQRNAPRLQTGDLLFVAGGASQMAEAISAATGADGALNFTHVGIAIARPGADSVVEATSPEGVRLCALAEFLAEAPRIGGRAAVVAMRLRDTAGVAAAVEQARRCVGLPYDDSFRPDNGKYYCSELVYESYRNPDGGPRFTARPMNFRAADGTMPAYWTELFERLGEPVPQGVAGTNPDDLAHEASLREVGRWF